MEESQRSGKTSQSELRDLMDTYSQQLKSFQHSQLAFPPDLVTFAHLTTDNL